MRISMLGSGYVGLVTGCCFADLGNKVLCIDQDKEKIRGLKKGAIPIYEPGLEELVHRNLKNGRLSFSTSIADGVKNADVIFITVGTPPRENGEADLSAVERVSQEIARNLRGYRLIVEKSTVPVETGEWIKHTVRNHIRANVKFDVASNPEFLREGTAINDFMHPDRIVIGVENKKAREILSELYRPLKAPIIVTDIKSAELIKHASNSFLAVKISYINAIANICERVGADIIKVADGIGLDRRIGHAFLNAGIGFGGFCLPKDLEAFIRISERLGYDFDILRATVKINEEQKRLFLKKVQSALWILNNKTIGVLGLSFKPDTDDIRFSPALDIIRMLQREGAKIKAYDPQAMEKSKKVLKDVKFCRDAYEVAKGSDCLLLLTEWNEYKELDLARIRKLLKNPVIIDGRNLYSPEKVRKLGFRYAGVGR